MNKFEMKNKQKKFYLHGLFLSKKSGILKHFNRHKPAKSSKRKKILVKLQANC